MTRSPTGGDESESSNSAGRQGRAGRRNDASCASTPCRLKSRVSDMSRDSTINRRDQFLLDSQKHILPSIGKTNLPLSCCRPSSPASNVVESSRKRKHLCPSKAVRGSDCQNSLHEGSSSRGSTCSATNELCIQGLSLDSPIQKSPTRHNLFFTPSVRATPTSGCFSAFHHGTPSSAFSDASDAKQPSVSSVPSLVTASRTPPRSSKSKQVPITILSSNKEHLHGKAEGKQRHEGETTLPSWGTWRPPLMPLATTEQVRNGCLSSSNTAMGSPSHPSNSNNESGTSRLPGLQQLSPSNICSSSTTAPATAYLQALEENNTLEEQRRQIPQLHRAPPTMGGFKLSPRRPLPPIMPGRRLRHSGAPHEDNATSETPADVLPTFSSAPRRQNGVRGSSLQQTSERQRDHDDERNTANQGNSWNSTELQFQAWADADRRELLSGSDTTADGGLLQMWTNNESTNSLELSFNSDGNQVVSGGLPHLRQNESTNSLVYSIEEDRIRGLGFPTLQSQSANSIGPVSPIDSTDDEERLVGPNRDVQMRVQRGDNAEEDYEMPLIASPKRHRVARGDTPTRKEAQAGVLLWPQSQQTTAFEGPLCAFKTTSLLHASTSGASLNHILESVDKISSRPTDQGDDTESVRSDLSDEDPFFLSATATITALTVESDGRQQLRTPSAVVTSEAETVSAAFGSSRVGGRTGLEDPLNSGQQRKHDRLSGSDPRRPRCPQDSNRPVLKSCSSIGNRDEPCRSGASKQVDSGALHPTGRSVSISSEGSSSTTSSLVARGGNNAPAHGLTRAKSTQGSGRYLDLVVEEGIKSDRDHRDVHTPPVQESLDGNVALTPPPFVNDGQDQGPCTSTRAYRMRCQARQAKSMSLFCTARADQDSILQAILKMAQAQEGK